ncbi:MAG: tRNA (guanosine(46)-N7)-methyltransferase TrmB [Janthinobacterium lividum]
MSQLLPTLQFKDISFFNKNVPIWLEIGFGGGEHLAQMAQENPNVQFIGCEVFQNGVASLLQHLSDENLKNVTVYSEDVRPFIQNLPNHCLSIIFIMFPDPWPKKKHLRRRLVNVDLITELLRVLTLDSGFRFASDHYDYVQDVETLLKDTQAFKSISVHTEKPLNWPYTIYNQKAIQKGTPSWYLEAWRG